MDYLDLAARLASRVDWRDVFPNPLVGCVIVRDGEVVASGVHEKYGGAHAEVEAILNLETGLRSETGLHVYITLEPCDHFEGKRTGSCTDRILELNPRKVVIGAIDGRFSGKNVGKLREAGIEVVVRNHKASEDLARVRPRVICKMAQTLDGRIYPHPQPLSQGERGAVISSLESRKRVHVLRSECDAILTTTRTLAVDNPRLDCRLIEKGELPRLVVFGSSEIAEDANIYQVGERDILRFDGKDLIRDLREMSEAGIGSVMTECGAKMVTSLLRENVVDELWMFVAPVIWGGGKDVLDGEFDLVARGFVLDSVEEVGGDLLLRYVRG